MSKSNYSRDGNYFVTLQQTSPTASLPNLPDHAGIGMNVNAAGTLGAGVQHGMLLIHFECMRAGSSPGPSVPI
jgi:hypothetical protein